MRKATVYRPKDQTTNNGISSYTNIIYVLKDGETVPKGCDQSILFVEQNRGGDYWAAIPVHKPTDKRGQVGPMFGGNLARADYDCEPERIYHIHDRYETQELNETLSR